MMVASLKYLHLAAMLCWCASLIALPLLLSLYGSTWRSREGGEERHPLRGVLLVGLGCERCADHRQRDPVPCLVAESHRLGDDAGRLRHRALAESGELGLGQAGERPLLVQPSPRLVERELAALLGVEGQSGHRRRRVHQNQTVHKLEPPVESKRARERGTAVND